MKTITLNLYSYDELSDKAKAKALREFNETHDDPMMQSHMINLLKEELERRGIKYDTDSIDVRYSLAYSQGDGFMFEGELYPEINGRKYTARIKHAGRYYHKYSRTIAWTDENGEDADDESPDFKEFEKAYIQICNEMEKAGYSEIEYKSSAEYFREACEANEWMFEEDGTIRLS